MPIAKDDHLTIKDFKGVNLTDPNFVIDDGQFESCLNMLVSDTGDLIRRKPLRWFQMPDLADVQVKMLGVFYNRLLFSTGDEIYLTPVDTDFSNTLTNVSGDGEATLPLAVLYNKNIYLFSGSSAPSLTGITVSNWAIDSPTFGSATLTGTAPTNICKAMIFKERCFAIKDPVDQSSRLFYSELNDPGNWQASGFVDVVPGDGDYITDILPFGERLFIFKRRATYVLIPAASPTSWIIKLFDSSVGCSHAYCSLETRGLFYTLSTRGLYRSDGTIYDYVGYPVYNRWKDRGPEAPDVVVAAYNAQVVMVDDHLFINTGNPDIGHWFYNPVTNAWTEAILPQVEAGRLLLGVQGYLQNGARGTWFGWDRDPGEASSILWFGLGDPDLPTNTRYEDYTVHDATPASRVMTPIATSFKTKLWDNGTFYRTKRHRVSTLEMMVPDDTAAGDADFEVTYYLDGQIETDTHEFLVTEDTGRGVKAHKLPGVGHHRRLQLEFQSDAVQDYTITGLDLSFFNKRTLSENPE